MSEQHVMDALFKCVDCGVNTNDINEYYMVHDHIWHSVDMASDGGMLCIGCLEERLGRQINAADFTDMPVNYVDFFDRSERLLSRLKAVPPVLGQTVALTAHKA